VILYFAGNAVTTFLERDLVHNGAEHRLLTFADLFDFGASAFEYWTGPDAPRPFFLDSGAFGAFTRGHHIDLNHYCRYIVEHQKCLACYACLDVIGDWKKSARNYERMRLKGLHPIPTFHMGSPPHELHRLCKCTDYIALGGVVGAHENDMKPWLDSCFAIIAQHWPIKVHLFGVLAQWALERYPLYSADGSSALVSSGMGRVIDYIDGKVSAKPWVEYARDTLDGQVMDHISHLQAKKGSAHRGRRVISVRAFLRLQRHVSDVWTDRGITWPEPPGASKIDSSRKLDNEVPTSAGIG
jgi:hypothetical protein